MRRFLACTLAAAALGATGCGSEGSGGDTAASAPAPQGPDDARLREKLRTATTVAPGTFPDPKGRTLQQVADALNATGPSIAFATATLRTGEHQRLAFGLLDEQQQFVYAPTALYVARPGEPALGPYTAPADLLVTDPAFRSETAASEEDPFAAVYEAYPDLVEPGRYDVLTISKIDGQDVAAGATIQVERKAAVKIPDVGQPAPRVPTETLADAGGDIASIDTRRPPSTMHETSLDDALGKTPVVLLFATPQLCASRVCGPVVDIAEQLKKTYGDRATFIHQEVYVDNDVEKGLRAPLKAFGLPTEPWLFTIGADGKVAARLEGSFGFNAFERAVKAAL